MYILNFRGINIRDSYGRTAESLEVKANTLTVWVELGRRMLYIPFSVTPDRRISAQSRKASGFPFGRLEISEKKKNMTNDNLLFFAHKSQHSYVSSLLFSFLTLVLQ